MHLYLSLKLLPQIFLTNHLHLLSCQQGLGSSVRVLDKFPIFKHYICIACDEKNHFGDYFHIIVSYQKDFLKKLGPFEFVFDQEVGQNYFKSLESGTFKFF